MSERSPLAIGHGPLAALLRCGLAVLSVLSLWPDAIAQVQDSTAKATVASPDTAAILLNSAPVPVSPWISRFDHTHVLRLEVSSMYDSNVLRNDLVTALWQGGTISREVRQRSEGTSTKTNRAGYVLEGTLSYAWGDTLFGNGHMRPRLSLAYRDLFGIRFSDDLYHVTFFGNADYENAVAELGASAFEKVRYQSFGFGFEDVKTRSFLMVQLVSGQDISSADIDRADLFTATDGQYLRMDLDGSYARSEDDNISGWRSRGVGAAISAHVNAALCGMALSIGVEDLGAIAWNERSLRVPKDTVILYEGIRVEDALDLDGVLVDRNSLQDTLGLSYEAGAFLRPLPTKVYAGLVWSCAYAMRYAADVDVRNLPGYLPHAVLSAEHFYRHNAFRAETSFGGFGGWRVGLGAGHIFGEGLLVELRVPNIIGTVSESARGRGVALNVEFSW